MAEGEITQDDLVNYVSGQILSGPEDAIWDDIFDWVANAVDTIVGSITRWWNETVMPWFNKIGGWITAAVAPVFSWFLSVWRWIQDLGSDIWGWITTEIGEVWGWIVTETTSLGSSIWAWFSEQWANIAYSFSTLGADIVRWWSGLTTSIGSFFTDLWLKIQAGYDWLTAWMTENIVAPIAAWWDQFLERLFDFGAWVGGFLEAVWKWVSRDVPGSSPWYEGILNFMYDLFIGRLIDAWKRIFGEGLMAIPNILLDNLKWLGGLFSTVFEGFMDAMMGLLKQLGPISPDTAAGNYSSMAKVGMVALGGLAGMTLAGSWLKPLGGAGMGNIAAMIYDMTNYKLITGAFMGAVTVSMLKTPLTYYFNDLFRPWLLRQGDFMELMAREAFVHPEKLRVPELSTTVQEVTGGRGTAFESKMIGYYGFPASYYGFFKELSFAPLRYFPLAGIARAGYWDEDWYTEALSRSGYSPTARAALMDMYREQVLVARQLPVMSQVRRLSREGFATTEEIKAHLEKAAAMVDMTECRLFAMELEQEFCQKEMAFDIIMRAFSRGIIPEPETISGLAGLGIPGPMIDLHLFREKMGLMRRISIPTEAAAPPIIGVEE